MKLRKSRKAQARENTQNISDARKLLEADQAAINAALKVLTSEEADEIIGSPSASYNLLGQGIQPLCRVLLRTCLNNKLKRKKVVLKAWSQHMLLAATLVHQAYALGIKEGQLRGDPDPTPDGHEYSRDHPMVMPPTDLAYSIVNGGC